MLIYSEKQVIGRLRRLSAQAGVAFSASCATRLLPAYNKMTDRLPDADRVLASRVLAAVWDWTLDSRVCISARDIENLVGRIVHEDEGESYAYAIADDVLSSIVYAARAARVFDIHEAEWAARRAYEATDRFVSRKMNASEYTSEMEATILANDIVQQELQRQQRDMSDLERADANFERVVSMLRERSQGESALPLDALSGF